MSALLLGSGCLDAAAAQCQGRREGAWAAEPRSKAEGAVSVGALCCESWGGHLTALAAAVVVLTVSAAFPACLCYSSAPSLLFPGRERHLWSVRAGQCPWLGLGRSLEEWAPASGSPVSWLWVEWVQEWEAPSTTSLIKPRDDLHHLYPRSLSLLSARERTTGHTGLCHAGLWGGTSWWSGVLSMDCLGLGEPGNCCCLCLGGVLRASSLLIAVRGLVLLAADQDKSQADECCSISCSLPGAFALCSLAAPGSQWQEENLAGDASHHSCHSSGDSTFFPGMVAVSGASLLLLAVPSGRIWWVGLGLVVQTRIGVKENWRPLCFGLQQVWGAGGGWCRSDQWSEEVNAGGEPGAEGLFAGRQREGEKVNIQVEEGRAPVGTVAWGEQQCFPAAGAELPEWGGYQP